MLTRVISSDCSLHNRFHPFTDDILLGRAEEMRLVGVMHDSESIASRIGVLICKDLVTYDIDISFDLGFLTIQRST